MDADGDTNLTLTVDWGDGSKPQQSQPGIKPFAVTHKYAHAGTYTVHVTWTDSTGLSNSRDLKIKVEEGQVGRPRASHDADGDVIGAVRPEHDRRRGWYRPDGPPRGHRPCRHDVYLAGPLNLT